MKRSRFQLVVPVFLFIIHACTSANENKILIEPGTPEETVKHLYTAVSVEAEEVYDWDIVRSMFLKDPVIVLRTSREGSTVFTMEGFIDDFKAFVERAKIIESGFKEEIIEMKSNTIGDISNIVVVYEASIPGSEKSPQKGVDMIHLINTDKGWKISSIINEIPDPTGPLSLDLIDVAL